MPFTLVAFEETQAAGTLVNVAGLADPHIRVSGDDIWVPAGLNFLVGYYALGENMSQARFESPSLRRLANLDVAPFDLGLEPMSNPPFHAALSNPKALEATEALNFLTTNAATNRSWGLAWLANGPITPVTGEIFTIKATASTTLTAYAWTNGAITFASTLPIGRYQVVGMHAKSAGLVAARLVFPGLAWRPGCIAADAYNDIAEPSFRRGAMGVWGEFDHDVPPTVDFLSVSADTSEEIWLDLTKIS